MEATNEPLGSCKGLPCCALRLQKASTCAAKHTATARLCACIPKEGVKQGGTALHQRRMLAAAEGSEGLSGSRAAHALRQQRRQRAAAVAGLSERGGIAALEVG